MKKVLCVILSLVMIVSLLPVSTLAADVVSSGVCGDQGDNVTWSLASDGTLTISGSGAMSFSRNDYRAPWAASSVKAVVVEDGVTYICAKAFSGCVGLKTVTVADSVIDVGSDAFDNTAWYNSQPDGVVYVGKVAYRHKGTMSENTELTLKSGTLAVASNAFAGQSTLKSVVLPKGITTVGYRAFSGCGKLESVTLPEGITTVGGSAFNYCGKLKSVSLPDSVTGLGNDVFSGCSGLTDVTIGKGLTAVPANTFYECGSLDGVTLPDGITEIGDSAFYGCGSLTSIAIPGSVAVIGNSAFYYCRKLAELSVGNGVTAIGRQAFAGCAALTDVSLPETVLSVGKDAFGNTGWLAAQEPGFVYLGHILYQYNYEVALKDPMRPWDGSERVVPETIELTVKPGAKAVAEDIFSNLSFYSDRRERWNAETNSYEDYTEVYLNNLTELAAVTKIELPDSLVAIGDYAFAGCSGVKEITIPKNVKTVGTSAFRKCTGLTKLTVAKGVTALSDECFRDCAALTAVTLPDSVTTLGESVFRDCAALTKLSTGDGLTEVPAYAFCGCTMLETVQLGKSVRSIGESAFNQCVWLTEITLPDSLTAIGAGAFSQCSGIRQLTIPDSVTEIGRSAFAGCMGVDLTVGKAFPLWVKSYSRYDYGEINNVVSALHLTEGVTEIPDSACYEWVGLTSVTIPESVTKIGYSAFKGCTGLTSVTIPSGVQEIGSDAFGGCTGLTSVTVACDLTSGAYAGFSDCKGLKSVTFSEGVKTIPHLFTYCTGLTSVTLPESAIEIGISAFYGCTGLTSITIPKNVETIGSSAFGGCTGLTDVTIPGSVREIGYSAFYGCTGLKSVTIPSGIQEIGYGAFRGCAGLTGITIPESVTSIESEAFSGCTGLTGITIPESVTTIGSKAFQDCGSLSELSILGKKLTISDDAFSGCDSLAKISMPNCERLDGSPAFDETPWYTAQPNGLVYLDKILYKYKGTMPDNTTVAVKDGTKAIAPSAFSGQKGLVSISLPDSVVSIGADAFYGCDNLLQLTIGRKVAFIGDYVLGWARTVIYCYAGSAAHQWAIDNNREYVVMDDPAITLTAPEKVSEDTVNVYGLANPGGTLTYYVNGEKLEQETPDKVSASGKWSAALPLKNVKTGDKVSIKATVTVDDKSASAEAEVLYDPKEVTFKEFHMTHQRQTVTVTAETLGQSVPNVTYDPAMPLSFRIAVTNNNRIGHLYLVSNKSEGTKRMELFYNSASGCWFASGSFDKGYIPGTFTVEGTYKNGKSFDTGVSIKINFLVDPSGYAYEAVQSNVLEGVTATIWYRDADGAELRWNADLYDQLNPVVTLDDGAFAWVVPEGEWQVRLTKDGFEETVSEWMTVPPEHTNVYLPMVTKQHPTLSAFDAYEDHAVLTFDMFMDIDTVNTENVRIYTLVDGNTVYFEGAVEPLDKTETAEGSGVYYARSFRFTPTEPLSGEIYARAYRVKNYAGMEIYDDSEYNYQKVTVTAEPKDLTATKAVSVSYGETAEIKVSAKNAAQRKVTVSTDSADVELSASELTLDSKGEATLTVRGNMPGEAEITFTVVGTSLSAAAKITVTASADPTDPDDTPEPETTTRPDTPAEPETTTKPDTPSEPETTTKPDTPSEPETTTKPDTPSEPETTTRPDAPTRALGDVDGDGEITSGDARLALRASVQLEKYAPDSEAFAAADVDRNGEISSGDARMILRASVKLETLA